ncbi:MAG TPA: hypothetical protein VIJ93_08550 [bacterium]
MSRQILSINQSAIRSPLLAPIPSALDGNPAGAFVYQRKQIIAISNDGTSVADLITYLRAHADTISAGMAWDSQYTFPITDPTFNLGGSNIPPYFETNSGSGWCDPGSYAGGGQFAAWISIVRLPLFVQYFDYENDWFFEVGGGVFPTNGFFTGNSSGPAGTNVTIKIPIPDWDTAFTFEGSAHAFDGLSKYSFTN